MDIATLACLKLLENLDCRRYINHPYCNPYMNYVMQWPLHLPIKTIIIGQNPYPGDIFPELGAALSYDESKISTVPASVRVLAEDLYNYDGTDKQDTIKCFRDSWHALEYGVVMINESVFHKISNDTDRPNTGILREMEFQVRTLQILLSVGFNLGQTSITMIGMGMGAAMMTSIIRPWCPSDLISAKVMTCSNPAAFSSMLGDSSSLQVTLGKSHISKVLSELVKSYSNMPPKASSADKRRQQNIDTFNSAMEEVRQSSQINNNELRSFKDRLARVDPSNPTKSNTDDLLSSIDSLTKANDRHTAALGVHSTTMLILLDTASKEKSRYSDKQDGAQGITNQYAIATSTPPSGPRRRVVRRSVSTTPNIESIVEDNTGDTESEVISVQSLATPTTRARRRVVRKSSLAPSEYTTGSVSGDVNESISYDMDPPHATYMRTFSNWFKDNYKNDPTYQVILSSAADSRTVDNPLSKDVLEYIKSRKESDSDYDPYDELSDPKSESSIWIKEYMQQH